VRRESTSWTGRRAAWTSSSNCSGSEPNSGSSGSSGAGRINPGASATRPDRASAQPSAPSTVGARCDSAAAFSSSGIACASRPYFEGLLFDADAPEPYPVFPVRGSYRVTDSEFVGVLRGTPLAELAGANVLLARNSYRASTAVDVIDADRSHVAILANRWDVNTRGVQVQQNMDGLPSRGSAIQVSGNEGRIVPYYLGDGLSYVDPFDPSYDPGGTSLRVSGNRWSLGDASLPATSGLSVVGAARLRILGNHLTGRVVSGVIVDQTTGCRVGRNAFDWETAGEEPDLRLGRDTSRCLVAVGLEDTVVDEGAENQVFRP